MRILLSALFYSTNDTFPNFRTRKKFSFEKSPENLQFFSTKFSSYFQRIHEFQILDFNL